MDPQQLKAIAAQLRKPEGSEAAEVVERMNKNNRNISLKTIELLELDSGDRILEIGPANGAYVAEILNGNEVKYTGIDYSADMVREAEILNEKFVSNERAQFVCGSSEDLPFEDGYFDKVFSVNTFYFWENPSQHLHEIRRVLKIGGQFNLGFGSRDFMEMLPFTEFGFNLYFPEEVKEYLLDASFRVDEIKALEPEIIEIAGQSIKKEFYIAICKKEY